MGLLPVVECVNSTYALDLGRPENPRVGLRIHQVHGETDLSGNSIDYLTAISHYTDWWTTVKFWVQSQGLVIPEKTGNVLSPQDSHCGKRP